MKITLIINASVTYFVCSCFDKGCHKSVKVYVTMPSGFIGTKSLRCLIEGHGVKQLGKRRYTLVCALSLYVAETL